MNGQLRGELKAWQYIEKGWCQHAFARNAQGNSCVEYSPDAICWCLFGAITVAYRYYPDLGPLYARLESLGFPTIPTYNDAKGRTKEEVISLLKEFDL